MNSQPAKIEGSVAALIRALANQMAEGMARSGDWGAHAGPLEVMTATGVGKARVYLVYGEELVGLVDDTITMYAEARGGKLHETVHDATTGDLK